MIFFTKISSNNAIQNSKALSKVNRHMYIVGVPIIENCTRGIKRQVMFAMAKLMEMEIV